MTQAEERILASLGSGKALPTMPAVAMEVVRLSQDPEVSIDRLAEVIEKDPALAAKTLRFANSSYYGAAKPIASVSQAVIRIGLRTAKLLALSFGLVEAASHGALDFDYPPFWRRCLSTAVTARRIAGASLRRLRDEVFIGGLLADIGCPLMSRVMPREYRSVVRLAENGAKRLCDAERSFLGVTHPVISAHLLRECHLPDDLVRAVAAHHAPETLRKDDSAFSVAAIIMTASEISDLVLHGSTLERIASLASAFRQHFSFRPEHVEILLSGIESEIDAVADLLDTPVPPFQAMQACAKREALRLALEKSWKEPAADPQAAGAGPSTTSR